MGMEGVPGLVKNDGVAAFLVGLVLFIAEKSNLNRFLFGRAWKP